ncbi:MAG: cupin domain-containing protein [Myxococcota bacterium]
MDADALIAALGLEPLGFEGGWFRETVRFNSEAPPSFAGLERSLHTAILYMLTPDTRGLMHRLRHGEVYHFYMGDPVDLVLLHGAGQIEHVVLGHDLAGGQRLQHHVPAGVWQGSRVRPGGRFGLMGTTMAPGFDLRDFELGDRESLSKYWPGASPWLRELTPDVQRTERLELVAATRDLLHAELRSPEALAAGTRGVVGPDWPPGPWDLDRLRREIAHLEAGPEQRAWWSWYVIRRSDRRLVGTGGFRGPPEEGQVHVETMLLFHELRDEVVEALRRIALRDPRVREVREVD